MSGLEKLLENSGFGEIAQTTGPFVLGMELGLKAEPIGVLKRLTIILTLNISNCKKFLTYQRSSKKMKRGGKGNSRLENAVSRRFSVEDKRMIEERGFTTKGLSSSLQSRFLLAFF